MDSPVNFEISLDQRLLRDLTIDRDQETPTLDITTRYRPPQYSAVFPRQIVSVPRSDSIRRRRIVSNYVVRKLRRDRSPTPPELQSNKCVLHMKRSTPRDWIFFNAGRRLEDKASPELPELPVRASTHKMGELGNTGSRHQCIRDNTTATSMPYLTNPTRASYYKFSDFSKRRDGDMEGHHRFHGNVNHEIDKMTYVLQWLFHSVNI